VPKLGASNWHDMLMLYLDMVHDKTHLTHMSKQAATRLDKSNYTTIRAC
jgi:hypothetical protein